MKTKTTILVVAALAAIQINTVSAQEKSSAKLRTFE